MITKIILALFLALFSLSSIPDAFAYNQIPATSFDQTHKLYCADSEESNDEYGDYEDEEEPDCD